MISVDKYLQEDLDVVANKPLDWEKFKNKTIFITGATGLIGSLLVKTFLNANDQKDLGVKVLAFIRNEKKARDLYGSLCDRDDFSFVIGDLTEKISCEEEIDYIIHGAAITTSKIMVERPVDTIAASLEGTKHVLELAVEKKVTSVVYLSSMEMYGSFETCDTPVTEDVLGTIDIKKVRSNYPMTKRMCENMCVAYLSQYDVPVKIARLSQTFGPGILPGENRVFAQFARSAMKGEDIILHTEGKSEGNYCYSADALYGILLILLKGENGESYNVCNEATHTTICDMAKMVCENFSDGKSKLVFDIPKENSFGYAADTHLKLSSQKLRSLGWEPMVDLKGAYKRLILSIKENE